ncbi:hypothetical protein ACE6H2_020743 [Prunus campanulata]
MKGKWSLLRRKLSKMKKKSDSNKWSSRRKLCLDTSGMCDEEKLYYSQLRMKILRGGEL